MASPPARPGVAFVRRYAGGITKSPSVTGVPPVPLQPRPQCTHINMVRLRGDYACDACGRRSPMGWLYLCAQDLYQQMDSVNHSIGIYGTSDEEEEMIALGLASSIIAQYRAGLYTKYQVEVLKAQKKRVLETIHETIHASSNQASMSISPPPMTDMSTAEKHSMAVPHRSDLDAAIQSVPREATAGSLHPSLSSQSMTACRFKCCHRCRPFLRDRLMASIGAILNDEEPPVTIAEATNFRVIDATRLRDLNYRPLKHVPPVPRPSPDYAMLSKLSNNTSMESLNIEDSPFNLSAAEPGSLTNSSSFNSPTRSTFSASSISLPLTPSSDRSFHRSDNEDFDFSDLRMRKADSWHFSSLNRISRIDVSRLIDEEPDPRPSLRYDDNRRAWAYAGGRENQASPGADRRSVSVSTSILGDLTDSCSSDDSAAVEVGGGVALTEEAVELRLPDIVTGQGLLAVDLERQGQS